MCHNTVGTGGATGIRPAGENSFANGGESYDPSQFCGTAPPTSRDPRMAHCLRYKRDGLYHDLTWEDYRAGRWPAPPAWSTPASSAGDRVGLLAENRVEWLIADMGILDRRRRQRAAACPADRPADSLPARRRRRHAGCSSPTASSWTRSARSAPNCRPLRGIVGLRPRRGRATTLILGRRSCSAAGGPAATGRRSCAAARDGSGPRRPGHDHVHLRHDRQPQGRDADARQPAEQRRCAALAVAARAGRRRAQLAAVQPHLRPHRRSLH